MTLNTGNIKTILPHGQRLRVCRLHCGSASTANTISQLRAFVICLLQLEDNHAQKDLFCAHQSARRVLLLPDRLFLTNQPYERRSERPNSV